MTKSALFPVVLATALTAAGLATINSFAAEQPDRPGGRAAQLLERIREKLELTDDQSAKIKAELAADKDTLKDLVTRIHEAKSALREAMQAKDATESSVRSAAAKVGAAQAEFAVERFKLLKRINPILTETQREKVRQAQAQLDEVIDGAVNRLGTRLGTE